MGYAEDKTDKELIELERTLTHEYNDAYKGISKKLGAYLAGFEERDKALRDALKNGTYPELEGASAGMTPEEHYKQWRLAQIGRGKRMEKMRDEVAKTLTNTNRTAADIINEKTPGVFSLNHNFTAYQIEKQVGKGVAFNLYNEQAVKNLLKGENHTEFRTLKVNPKRDYEWNQKKVQSALTSGILQGKSIPEMSDSFLEVMKSNKQAAVRNARTAVTSAQNAGVVEACKKAQEMGIEVQMQWRSAHDGRVRDSHAHLDGVRINVGEIFPNGCRYPGDPQGRPAEVYNCRCTLLKILPKYNGKTIESKNTEADYKAWMEGKKAVDNGVDTAIDEYTKLRKEYDKQVEHLVALEKETDDAQDAYMDVMDTPQAAEYEEVFNKKFEETERLKQIVKDLKAALSGKEARAVRQVEKNLAVKAGIPIDKVEMSGLQYDTADMIFGSYKIVLNKYPELKGQLASFKYDGIKGDAYASCIILTGEIKTHGMFANYDKLVQNYASDVAAGFHPTGTDHNSIIVHELGHALDGYMTKNKLLGADHNRYGTLHSASQTAKDMTLKLLGFDEQEIAIELKSQGLTLSQRRNILDEREKEFITKHISGYAADNEREFFAECFAEYMMSDNPREAAKIFGGIIESVRKVMQMFSRDATAEEILQFEYNLNKKGLTEFYLRQGWEKSGIKRFLINSLVHLSDPVGSLELIKNDSELKLTEDEWEYARKMAFECLKKRMIEECAITEDEMDSDELKKYFESMGFSDFVKNKANTEK